MNAWPLIAILFVAGAATVPPEPSSDDLDAQLLEGLDNAIDEAAETQPQPVGRQTAEQPPADPLDRDLLDDLGDPAGEDIVPSEAEAPGHGADPLTRLGQRMQEIERRIGRSQTGAETQLLQEQVVKDLDELIRQARKKAQQSSSSRGSPNNQQASQRNKPGKPGQGPHQQGNGHPGDAPARDSTDRLGPNDNKQPDMAEMQKLIEGLWGNLPQHARERVQQSAVEQFLPGYEELIEEYFRRLVEENEDR